MDAILALKLLHLLLFVYWLGGDLGTFYASRWVADASQPVAARKVAAQIMLAVDMAPRLSLPLILPTGIQLAQWQGRIDLPSAGMALIWLLCLGWLAVVWMIHQLQGSRQASLLTRFDLIWRSIVLMALLVTTVSAMTSSVPSLPWVGLKLGVYTLALVCGLLIRLHLRPFGLAFLSLLQDGPSEPVNQAIRSSIARCRPLVLLIWLALLTNAALGLHLF